MLNFGDYGIDRKGRIHCPCGRLMTRQKSVYPEGPNGEPVEVEEYGCSLGMTYGEMGRKDPYGGPGIVTVTCDNDCPLPLPYLIEALTPHLNIPQVKVFLERIKA